MTTFVAFSDTMTNTNSGYGGQTPGCDVREVIPVSKLNQTYTGWVQASIIIKSQSGSSGTLVEAHIGSSGGGTNNVNFRGDQAQVFWSSVSSLAMSGAQTYAASDLTAPFFYDPTVPLVISLFFIGTNDTAASRAVSFGAATNNYQLSAANQTGITTPTGSYTADTFYSWVMEIDLTEVSAPTALNLTMGSNGSVVSTCTTSTIAPTANNLVIASVTGSTAQVPTVTGAGGTWVLIASQFDGGGLRGVHMFRDLSATPGNGILTIDFSGVNQNFIGWSIDEFSGTDLTGTHGSGAIVQHAGTGTNSGTSTGITATLSAFGSASNWAYGFVRNNAVAAIVKGSGFTELSNQLAAELEAEWQLNQTAVSWTWASQTVVSVALAIEIKAFVAAAPPAITSSFLILTKGH